MTATLLSAIVLSIMYIAGVLAAAIIILLICFCIGLGDIELNDAYNKENSDAS